MLHSQYVIPLEQRKAFHNWDLQRIPKRQEQVAYQLNDRATGLCARATKGLQVKVQLSATLRVKCHSIDSNWLLVG